jgi:pectate lyase
LRQAAQIRNLGDPGKPDGSGRSLRLGTEHADWRALYALLELHDATGDDAFLDLARRVADNILKSQTKTGLFPRAGRLWARTGDEAPLAILHLAAALEGKRDAMPPAVFDSRFFHCEYHGELEERQKKRADKRTYDHLVFYGE